MIIPTISYRGTTLDSSMHDNILSGQIVDATLNVPGCWVDPDTYNWFTKATTAFYDFDPTATQYQQLTEITLYEQYPEFSFATVKKEDAEVECLADILCPDDETNFTVDVKKPLQAQTTTAAAGMPTNNLFGDPADHVYGDDEFAAALAVTVPSPFQPNNGVFCIAQVIDSVNVTDTRTPLNSKPATYTLVFSNGQGGWIPVSAGMLDTGYPYQVGYSPDGNSWLELDSSEFAVTALGATGDGPRVQYTPPAVAGDTGGTNWVKTDASEQFTDYLMYLPNPVVGGVAVWVPVAKLTWSWSRHGELRLGRWLFNHPTPIPGSWAGISTIDFPEWSIISPGSGIVMGLP